MKEKGREKKEAKYRKQMRWENYKGGKVQVITY